MTDWVRLWRDMPFDPKWRIVSRVSGRSIPEVIAVFSTMMVSAADNADRGSLASWRAEDTAAALDMDEAGVSAIFDAMAGRVHRGGRLTGWEKRNPLREDETAAARKRDERARKEPEKARSRNVTPESESETERDSTTRLGGANFKIPDAEDLTELAKLLAKAAGAAMADPAKFPALNDLSPIIGTLGPGRGPPCDLHRHVLPAIAAAAAGMPPGKIRNWRYVTGKEGSPSIISEYRDACESGAPLPTPNTGGTHGPGPARRASRFERNLAGALAAAQQVAARA